MINLNERMLPASAGGAVVKRRIQNRELAGSTPAITKCCVLDQGTLATWLSTGFYPERRAKNAR